MLCWISCVTGMGRSACESRSQNRSMVLELSSHSTSMTPSLKGRSETRIREGEFSSKCLKSFATDRESLTWSSERVRTILGSKVVGDEGTKDSTKDAISGDANIGAILELRLAARFQEPEGCFG